MRNKVFIFILVLTALFTLISKADAAPTPTAPPPYLPPSPYPKPCTADFPQPGDVVRYYTGGKTSDEIYDEANSSYFRSDEFKAQMKQVQNTAAQILGQNLSGTNAAAQFSALKQTALAAVQQQIDHIKAKVDTIYNEPSLNDNIARDIGEVENGQTGDPSLDNSIKAWVRQFGDTQIAYLENLKTQIQNATTTAELQTLAANAKSYKDDPALNEEFKIWASKIMGERILHFSFNVQLLVDFLKCMGVQLTNSGAVPMDEYNTYLFNTDSQFMVDWYSASLISQDSCRPWYDGNSYGAREEYRRAAAILLDDTCKASTDCRARLQTEMRKAKKMLQDMFHIFMWAYTDLQDKLSSNPGVLGSILNSGACPVPQIPWQQNVTGDTPPSQFPPGWGGSGPTPTPRPRLRDAR